MPRCVEPCTPRSPRSDHEPVSQTTLDGISSGSRIKLKEMMLCIVDEQHEILVQQLETQHDLFCDAIDKVLKVSSDPNMELDEPRSATSHCTSQGGTPEHDCHTNASDAAQLLVIPAKSAERKHRTSVSMCDITRAEMHHNVNHDITESRPTVKLPNVSIAEAVEARVSYVRNSVASTLRQRWSWQDCHSWFSSLYHRLCNHLRHVDEEMERVRERMSADVASGKGIFDKAGGGKFDACIGIIILANSVVMAVQLQWQGYEAGLKLGLDLADDGWSEAETSFFILEHIFNAIFVLELVMRLYIFRIEFFTDRTNIFDFLLVSLTSLELYILSPMKYSLGVNVSFLRVVRLVKLVRVLRVVRVFKLFRNLRVLVMTVAASAHALVWSVVLISVIIMMSGIFMCQLVQSSIVDESMPQDLRSWAWQFYGSSSRATYTMFEATLSGCWPNYARPLVTEFSPWYALFFVCYITGVHFAVVRIITAIFLKETLMVANNDSDMMVTEKLYTKHMYISKLKTFFKEADKSGDGLVDFEEFSSILSNADVKPWLACLDLEIHETVALFHLLDDGDGLITYDEFLKGALRLKGHARSSDIVAIMHDITRLQRRTGILQDLIMIGLPRSQQARAKEYLNSAAPHLDIESKRHQHSTERRAADEDSHSSLS